MINVAVADDHDVVRVGLKRILDFEDDIRVIWSAGNGQDALKLLGEQMSDVFLLDLDLPDMDGLEVTVEALKRFPGLKIVILTMHDDEEYAERVMKAGACGYALKASSTDELPEIIRTVFSGGTYINPSIMKKTVMKLYKAGGPAAPGLSEREKQILRLLAGGGMIKEIAAELHLSPSTVATHKRRLMDKLGLENNADIVHYAVSHGMIRKKDRSK